VKTILITGCSSGFGLQMVEDLLIEGHRVVATLRNASERMEIFGDFSRKYGDRLIIKSLDVISKEEREEVKLFIQSELNGELDALINNAGVGYFGALEDFSEEQIRSQMELNFFAPVFLTRDHLPFLRKSKGSVINVSSIMGQYSTPLGSLYSASKYALEGVTEGLSYELESFGVSSTTIAPGGHRTGFLDSVVWAKDSQSSHSVYSSLTGSFLSLMKKLGSREKAPDSRAVSRAVVKLIRKKSNGKKLAREVIVGKDAWFVVILQNLLPKAFYQGLMSMSYRLMLKRSTC
jgi:NAD(P)-dependent dehydrogenase (short-subunit alcohol dehydrogenase family)